MYVNNVYLFMTEICKYSYDINDILRNNNWNNDIDLINCIDNETNYNVNLNYNGSKIELMTVLKVIV